MSTKASEINQRARAIITVGFIIIFVIALYFASKPVDFESFKAMDLALDQIDCGSLLGHQEDLDDDGMWLPHKSYENIHVYELRSGYNFQQCRKEISTDLNSRCARMIEYLHRVATSPTTYSTHWLGIGNDKEVCEKQWNKHVASYNSEIVVDYNKNLPIYLPDYDIHLNPSNASRIIKRKASYGNYWVVRIYISEVESSVFYDLLYARESEADKALKLMLTKPIS